MRLFEIDKGDQRRSLNSVHKPVCKISQSGEPNFRELEPRDGLAAAVGPSQECSVRGYPFSAFVPERPRKTKMARLSALISSEVSDPTSLPSRLLGTAVNLSTFIRHGERRPLWSPAGWKPEDRCWCRIGGQGAHDDRVVGVESVVLDDDCRSRCPHTPHRLRRSRLASGGARFDSYARSPVPQTLLAAIWLQCARVLTEHPTFKV